jgi:8-oxo-dGTP diphosphatase
MDINRFNIRVYFILKSQTDGRILLSDERIQGKPYTKFPGGGLEFGEGPEDCAKREAMEELGQEIKILAHLYTTGFFQPSAFRKSDQIISIYYHAELMDFPAFNTGKQRFDFQDGDNTDQVFRWVSLEELDMEEFELPIDKHVVGLLKRQYSSH